MEACTHSAERNYALLIAISALAMGFCQDEEACPVEISIPRNSENKSSVGESLTLRCPVQFCSSQLPNVTWCKLIGVHCAPIIAKPGIVIEWTEREGNKGVYLLKFVSVNIIDTGRYRCAAEHFVSFNVGHAIKVTVNEACPVEISIPRNSENKHSVGESLTLRCPVQFCSLQLPNVTWCKLTAEQCAPIIAKPGISFEWTEREDNKSVYLLKFGSVNINDTGSYRCSAEGFGSRTVGHAIKITVEACPVEISIPRNSENKSSVGESLTLRCPVHFCPSQLPNVTWCKLNAEQCAPIIAKLGISFEWTEQEGNKSVYLLKFVSVSINDTGSYRCSAELLGSRTVGLVIKVTVECNILKDSFEVRNRSKIWLSYSLVLVRLFVIIVLSYAIFHYIRKIKETSCRHAKEKSIGKKVRLVTDPRTVNISPARPQPGDSSHQPRDRDPPTESIEII